MDSGIMAFLSTVFYKELLCPKFIRIVQNVPVILDLMQPKPSVELHTF
mgnify:FL=1